MIVKKISLLLCVLGLVLSSCSMDIDADPPMLDASGSLKGSADGGSPGGDGQQSEGLPGKITAGEWNDLENWMFWGKLMTTDKSDQEGGDYTKMSGYWRFYTDRRVAVEIKNAAGEPQNGVTVKLLSDGQPVWTSVSDCMGRADGWVGLYDSDAKTGTISVSLNGVVQDGEPVLTEWPQACTINSYVFSAPAPERKADILFIVDATGSMSDEIAFLKADLQDILGKVMNMQSSTVFRTASLFYRDIGDDYLTIFSPFTNDISSTIGFISEQAAAGGQDYPEAVHTALEVSLADLDWSESAQARLAFMLLDAPAHQNVQGVIESLQSSIRSYAEKGIKLIPVASSGVDKNTEFMLRFFAIATGGTYVFITDDSGIGHSHLPASVGSYKVEILGDLLVRLIDKYVG